MSIWFILLLLKERMLLRTPCTRLYRVVTVSDFCATSIMKSISRRTLHHTLRFFNILQNEETPYLEWKIFQRLTFLVFHTKFIPWRRLLSTARCSHFQLGEFKNIYVIKGSLHLSLLFVNSPGLSYSLINSPSVVPFFDIIDPKYLTSLFYIQIFYSFLWCCQIFRFVDVFSSPFFCIHLL